MKTLMIAFMLTGITAVTFANTASSVYPVLDYKTATEAQYRTVYEAMLSATNGAEAIDLMHRSKWGGIMINPNSKHLVKVFDDELAQRFPDGSFGSAFWGPFVKISKLRREALGIDILLPKTSAIIEKYQPVGISAPMLKRAGAPIEDIIAVMGELVVSSNVSNFFHTLIVQDGLKLFKTTIQQMAGQVIKRKLREQGKTFVTKNGVNPCEEYLTRLNVALDAPNFSGLNEWLSELGYDVQIDTSKFPTEEQLAKLKESVYYGDVKMTEKAKVVLMVGLGVDGYNLFVKDYNGDK